MSIYAYGAIVAQALIWILWKLKYGNLTIGSAFVIAIINAQYLLVEFDFAGYSLRVYAAIAGTLVYSLPRMGLVFKRLGNTGLLLLGLGILEAIWRFALAVRFGADSGAGGISQWASYWLVPLLCFCVVVAALKSEEDVKIAGFFMTGHIVVNAVFGVLQWLDVAQAWSITRVLRPITANYRVEVLFSEALNRGYAPGLQGFSVALSYLTLVGFVALSLYWLRAFDSGRRARALFLAALAIICLAGSVAALSRSSCYLSVGFLCLLIVHGRSAIHYKVGIVALVIAAVGIGLTQLAESEVNADQVQRWDASRLMSVFDSSRAVSWLYILGEVAQHPIVPAAAQADVAMLEVAPHNHFLNALYYGGLFSAAIQTIMMLGMYRLIKGWLRMLSAESSDLEARHRGQAAAWCLLAYFLKGLAHNDSFATGGGLGWLILAYFIANISAMYESTGPKRMPFAPPNVVRSARHRI